MKTAIQFVRGAVAAKDLIPVLTHIHISGGRVQGTNGAISMDAPCPDLGHLCATVPADKFLRAVDACDGNPDIRQTDAKNLVIKKGAFRAILPHGDVSEYPIAVPDSASPVEWVDLVDRLRVLRPFVGQDASRPWACGVLVDGQYAYATNNVAICRIPCDWDTGGRALVIPATAVNEILRVKDSPTEVCTGDGSITVWYGDAWLRARLVSAEWPDTSAFFAACDQPRKTVANTSDLLLAIERILPFCPDPKFPVIRTGGSGVSTADGGMQASVGGMCLPESLFRVEPLLAVLRASTSIDLSLYPAPCPFRNDDGLEGVIVGVRQ